MIYGEIGDIVKIERIKFSNGEIDPRNCHYGIIIANEVDLCTFLLATHRKQSEKGTYFFLHGNEFCNKVPIKKHVNTYVRFKEEFETNKNLEVVGRIKCDGTTIRLLKAYRQYLEFHEQIVINVGDNKESKVLKKV